MYTLRIQLPGLSRDVLEETTPGLTNETSAAQSPPSIKDIIHIFGKYFEGVGVGVSPYTTDSLSTYPQNSIYLANTKFCGQLICS